MVVGGAVEGAVVEGAVVEGGVVVVEVEGTPFPLAAPAGGPVVVDEPLADLVVDADGARLSVGDAAWGCTTNSAVTPATVPAMT